ncbi:unnamed protein product [Urochloa decumbens]|uniref:RBR-type E3 ubiquitin transferase n=1 Tax=Urochloa decumbens TaxID=240449 RepID=A0ABC9AIB2_9POAL
MASGGETSSNNNRRKRDDDDDGETSCGKRSLLSDDDDYMYEYDDDESGGEYCDHYGISDAEEEVAPVEEKKPYVILTEEVVRKQQADNTAKVAEVLSIPPAFAAFLLRRYKWDPTNLQEDWFSDDRRVRAAAGLPPADGGAATPVATALSTSPLICNICFDTFPAGRTRSAACLTHFYCEECWRGYIDAAIGDGAHCLSLRCPDPSCPAAVVGDLIAAVADAGDRDRYARFAFRSYVEENGGRIKWCPGRRCARAVEFVDIAGDDATTENQGCNHMRCVCGHHFCWLCFKPAGTQDHYACDDVYRPRHGSEAAGRGKAAVESKAEATARRARSSLDRYLVHYERWAGNLKSLQKAKQDMEELERSELEGMAKVVGRPVTELDFMKEAYKQVVYGRRVLRWAHAYGYYLDPETDGTKRQLFDFLQGQANQSLETLHEAAELEKKDIFWAEGDAVDIARRYKEYKQKMLPLTAATKNFMANLVKAFETDLPEVGTMNF